VASPVKKPVASEMPRCAPPYTDQAGEEPWEGETGNVAVPQTGCPDKDRSNPRRARPSVTNGSSKRLAQELLEIGRTAIV